MLPAPQEIRIHLHHKKKLALLSATAGDVVLKDQDSKPFKVTNMLQFSVIFGMWKEKVHL